MSAERAGGSEADERASKADARGWLGRYSPAAPKIAPPLNSLWLRLIVGAALWSIVALVAAGVILTSLYQQTVENAFDERLGVYLKTLVGALATQRPPASSDPGNLGEQRFEQLYSGWYWQVRRSGGPVVLASRSLFTDELQPPGPQAGEDDVMRTVMEGPDGQTLRVVEQRITYDAPQPGDPSLQYDLLIAGNADELRDDVAEFRTSVILTLAVFGLGLIVSTMVQIRWGLRPLDQVRRGLADLRTGKEHRFEGPFPAEIAPLARELNALLTSNQEVIERARTQVGNLAHALKTPLSVITNEARSGEGALAAKVAEQAELMRVQVNHYLNRARIAARSEVIGSVTPVEPQLARLARAMKRIYGERGIAIRLDVPSVAQFRGEQQDLEEIVGNLLDNACKWSRSTVVLSATYEAPSSDGGGLLTLSVADDGPGMTPEQCAEATRRGRRLDESKPGSGLGLSIVSELVSLYGGRFTLSRSTLGGLHAEVGLPAA